MQVTIKHKTRIDRGYLYKESVEIILPPGTQQTFSLRVHSMNEFVDYVYRTELQTGGKTYTLRRIREQQIEPVLSPELEVLVEEFEAVGWQAETQRAQANVGFGVYDTDITITITPGEGAQDVDTALSNYLTFMIDRAN
ncbi:MAG: hypothetical protein JW966_01670 [Anaerolineae bacterium]|nr:hypothetical protein [Anaerolineae bacterium]